MIVWNDQERADRDAMVRQLGEDLGDARLGRRGDVVDGNDQGSALRFRREREEGRQRRRTGSGHAGIFGPKSNATKPNRWVGTARCTVREDTVVFYYAGRRSAAFLPRHSQNFVELRLGHGLDRES